MLPSAATELQGPRALPNRGEFQRLSPTTSHNVAATDCKTYTLEKKSRYTPYLSPMASRRRGIDAIVRKSSLTGANRNLDRHSREDQDDTDSLHAPVCSHVPLRGCHEVIQYLVQYPSSVPSKDVVARISNSDGVPNPCAASPLRDFVTQLSQPPPGPRQLAEQTAGRDARQFPVTDGPLPAGQARGRDLAPVARWTVYVRTCKIGIPVTSHS